MAALYTLKVTLEDLTPVVSRTLQVPDTATLRQLHLLLQTAFGWQLRHPHHFEVGEAHYGDPFDDDAEPESLSDDGEVTLGQVTKRGENFLYLYDARRHRIEVPTVATQTEPGSARLLDGEGTGPGDDG